VFPDGSGKTHKAVVVWKQTDLSDWQSSILIVERSTQIFELSAALHAFELFLTEPLNVVADSAYVVGIVQCIEDAMIKEVNNKQLFSLLLKLATLLKNRAHLYFIMHIQSHTTLPGPITEGNAVADQLTMTAVLLRSFEQARLSHDFFHQNASSLRKQFASPRGQATEIVRACPDCQCITPVSSYTGVNHRGLQANELWQSDVTHISTFDQMRYVHVSADTFSGFLVATAHMGEKAHDVKCCFATMGIPKTMKTDNGPAYVSQTIFIFPQDWGIQHVTGILHSPTGQAIVERVHGTLKAMLNKQKRGNPMGSITPQEQLHKALDVLNFLNCSDQQLFTTAADCQFGWSPHLWLDQKYGIKNLGDHNGQVL